MKRNAIEQWESVNTTLSSTYSFTIIIGVFCLMILNWVSESYKWKILLEKVSSISLGSAINGVFAGITFSLFTPNRLGEPAGRLLFLPSIARKPSVLAMSVGAISQMIITYSLGLIGLIYFNQLIKRNLGFNFPLLIAFLISIVLFVLLLYLNLGKVSKMISSISLFKKHSELLKVYEKYNKVDLLTIFFIALLRYSIYSFQYVLLIHMFLPELALLKIASIVPVLFMAQSIIPSFALTDLGIRGSMAVYFFGYITNQSLAVISAAFLLWFINIIIPSLIGCFFILRLNYSRVSTT